MSGNQVSVYCKHGKQQQTIHTVSHCHSGSVTHSEAHKQVNLYIPKPATHACVFIKCYMPAEHNVNAHVHCTYIPLISAGVLSLS